MLWSLSVCGYQYDNNLLRSIQPLLITSIPSLSAAEMLSITELVTSWSNDSDVMAILEPLASYISRRISRLPAHIMASIAREYARRLPDADLTIALVRAITHQTCTKLSLLMNSPSSSMSHAAMTSRSGERDDNRVTTESMVSLASTLALLRMRSEANPYLQCVSSYIMTIVPASAMTSNGEYPSCTRLETWSFPHISRLCGAFAELDIAAPDLFATATKRIRFMLSPASMISKQSTDSNNDNKNNKNTSGNIYHLSTSVQLTDAESATRMLRAYTQALPNFDYPVDVLVALMNLISRHLRQESLSTTSTATTTHKLLSPIWQSSLHFVAAAWRAERHEALIASLNTLPPGVETLWLYAGMEPPPSAKLPLIHQEIHEMLTQMSQRTPKQIWPYQYPVNEVIDGTRTGGYWIDVVMWPKDNDKKVVGPSTNLSLSSSADDNNDTMIIPPVAIEVDGPTHFDRSGDVPLGHTLLKRRTLMNLGWHVGSAHFKTWALLSHDPPQAAAYLISLLPLQCQRAIPPDVIKPKKISSTATPSVMSSPSPTTTSSRATTPIDTPSN
jgi:hypothetical protein